MDSFEEKTESGSIELSKQQYDERSNCNAQNIDRQAEREIIQTPNFDGGSERNEAGTADGNRNSGRNAAVFGQAVREELRNDTRRSLHSSSGNGFGTAVEESDESKYQQRTHALTDREMLAKAASQVMLDDLTEAEKDGFLSFTRDYRVQKRRWLSPSANLLLLRYTGRGSENEGVGVVQPTPSRCPPDTGI